MENPHISLSGSQDSLENSEHDFRDDTRAYPSDDFINFQQRLTALKASNHALHPLVECLEGAWGILRQSPRIRQIDLDSVRRFFRDDITFSMEKLLSLHPNTRGMIDEDAAFEALLLLVLLAATALEYRQRVGPEAKQDLDSDLGPVLQAVLSAFNNSRPLHCRMSHMEVPAEVASKHCRDYVDGEEWVSPKYDPAAEPLQQMDDDMAAEQEDSFVERHAWWTYIVNTFGHFGGFSTIIAMMEQPAQVNFTFLNTSLAVLAQVVDDVTPEAKELFSQVIQPVADHVLQLVEADSDRLSDYGSDRTYNNYTCLTNINLHRIIQYTNRHAAFQQLWLIKCTFIIKMLESSSFNKLLSGARECNKMLHNSAGTDEDNSVGAMPLQDLLQWMHEKEIVQRLLRTGLHHRQYMQEVKGIMVSLTECQALTREHLDLIWAVTEKEDTYDAVKTHMFDLLAEIASNFVPSQLDMLFAKLDRHQVRSVQDTQRLLTLLHQLACSDTERKMFDKIIKLVWDLTIPADSPPELLECRALENVVNAYMEAEKEPGGSQTCFRQISDCVEALKQGLGGQVPLLRNMKELLKLLPNPVKTKIPQLQTRSLAVDHLEKTGVFRQLVKAVCNRVAAARKSVDAALAAAGSSSTAAPDAAAAAAAKADAMAALGDGNWSYLDVIREYLTTLRVLAMWASNFLDEPLSQQLWDALMVNAPCGEDQLLATQSFFRTGFMGYRDTTAFFDVETQQKLLKEHMVNQDVEHIPFSAARLTWDVFLQVNTVNQSIQVFGKNNPRHVAHNLHTMEGLELIWRMYLCSQDERVADMLRSNLLTLYHSNVLLNQTFAMRKALIQEVVKYMREAARAMSGPSDQVADSSRILARCLSMAIAAVHHFESATMPPVPAHNLAWRGRPLVLEIQREGTNRQRLVSHTNEYIGLLRERLAKQMGCSAKNIRMFLLGQEMGTDSVSLSNWGIRGRSILTVMVSPEPNKFSCAPSEHRQMFEETSLTWMLSQATGVYPLLLRFIDGPHANQDIANMALELLNVLPTYPALTERLAAALDGADKQQQLASILDTRCSSMLVDATPDAAAAADTDDDNEEQEQRQQLKHCGPHQTLYALQALCALLFPTFDDALLSTADGEACAEGSACPSPAAAPAATAPNAPAAAGPPAAVAAASMLQQHHHRELQQQDFLQSHSLEVVLEAAHKAASSSAADLKLRRQLSELLVVLVHNLIDAAQAWQVVHGLLGPPAGSSGLDVMSGAESGAGYPAPGAAVAPASSLVAAASGGTAGAAGTDSGAVAMTGVQAAADGGAGSSVAGGDSEAGGQICSNTAAATADTTHHPPSSPTMEVSSPLPGHQQQQLQAQQQNKQRQRSSDLPPLPPPGQQLPTTGSGGTSNPAAAAGPSLATLLGSHTLKLMADTLLGVAVDTSRLWGSKSGAAAALADDENNRDVAVARDALQLLLRLLEQHPPLVQLLLLEVEKPPLLSVVLLNPYYSALRRQAAELFEKLVSGSNKQRLLPWLLTQLAAARPLAQQHPGSSAEFYQLLASMLTKMGTSWNVLPEQLFVTANAMLDEEVAALRSMTTAGPQAVANSAATSTSSQQQRRRPQQPNGSAKDADVPDDDSGSESTTCTLLQGRLLLVLALVRTLDRRAIGSEGHGGLIKLLLQDFLFPEAVQQLAAASGQLDLQRCAASLEPHCATAGCRKAALELLAELMGDTPSSLEEGVSMLMELHYQRQVLERNNAQARALRGPGQYSGLRNGGATCYMNAVFQQLFMQPGIRARILGAAEVEPPEERPNSVFSQLQGLFAQLALGKATYANPAKFWASFKDYDGTPIDVREHQDAYEFFTRLQDCVDQHLISTGQQPAIKPVMGGTFVQQIICRGHDFTSERNEDFYQISVEVKGMGSLQKSLDDYVKGELMEGDNAYLCEELGKRVPAVKRTAIRVLPQMLCVHLKRFEFDYHNQTRHKLRDRFEFPLELNMFPYTAEGLAAADQQKAAEEQQQQQQDQQGQQQPQRPLPRMSSSGATAAAASNAGPYMYDLRGVVVHSGSAFTGHYYSFIKERVSSSTDSSSSSNRQPQWYCFDDKDVSPWDVSNLETDCFGGKASQDSDARAVRPQRNEYERAHSAYMLFYERCMPPGGSSSGVDKQQQRQQADADGDTEMAAVGVEQQATVATFQPLPQQQQQQQQPSFSIPYGMPVSLYRDIMQQNIDIMWQQHVLDKDYFRFVRQLVDSRGDLGQLATRKARRRDATLATPGTATAAAAASGSSGRIHSNMSCDPAPNSQPPLPQQQQQQQALQQPNASGGAAAAASGPLPMAASPSPAAGIAAGGENSPAQAAAGHVAPVDLSSIPPGTPAGMPDPQQSPGPSSRRGEEAEAVAQALMRLGVLFQFLVYLKAHESLRSESNVWTEALTSLMGSSQSSTACMQVFLELLQYHPEWLRSYLLDCQLEGATCPRKWAADMIGWVLEAATKRCTWHLQQAVTVLMATAAAAPPGTPGLQQQQQQHERAIMQQLMPPVGQSLLGVVDQLVLLIRSCVPRRSPGQGLGQVLPDLPSEPARVLLRYASTTPWAAVHLLQVVNLVPDLVELIAAGVASSGDMLEDDFTLEDLMPLYHLLHELLSWASNLPELVAEHQGCPASPNHYLQQLPSSSNGSSAEASEAAAAGMHAILPEDAFRRLSDMPVSQALLRGLASLPSASSRTAGKLTGLLTYSNALNARVFCAYAAPALQNLLKHQPDYLQSQALWDHCSLNLTLSMLQPDSLLYNRICFWLTGHWEGPMLPVLEPSIMAWDNPLSYHSLNFCRLINALCGRLKDGSLFKAELTQVLLGQAFFNVKPKVVEACEAINTFFRQQQHQQHDSSFSNAALAAFTEVNVLISKAMEYSQREQQQRQQRQHQQQQSATAATATGSSSQ